jgi:hypothetical protein
MKGIVAAVSACYNYTSDCANFVSFDLEPVQHSQPVLIYDVEPITELIECVT